MNTTRKHVDRTLLGIILALLVVGAFMLASASVALSQTRFGTPYQYLIRQFAYGMGVGGILFFLALRLPLTFFKKWSFLFFAASIILLILVLIPPFGSKFNGAHRWITFGSFSFQPSEVAKMAYLLYLAAWLSNKRKEITSIPKSFAPFVTITGGIFGLIMLQPNLSTAGIIGITGFAMYFLAGGKLQHLLGIALVGILAGGLLVSSGYRRDRITTFLNPQADINNKGYQINQALIAIGSGGFFGKGLGLSRQKFNYLPEAEGDAIFAVLAEEFGLLGGLGLLTLFFWFASRGMIIAARAKDSFSQLLASGIVIMVTVQAMVNIAALTGLFPLTGVPLPFVSYGGTALALLLFEMGLLLHISRRNNL